MKIIAIEEHFITPSEGALLPPGAENAALGQTGVLQDAVVVVGGRSVQVGQPQHVRYGGGDVFEDVDGRRVRYNFHFALPRSTAG